MKSLLQLISTQNQVCISCFHYLWLLVTWRADELSTTSSIPKILWPSLDLIQNINFETEQKWNFIIIQIETLLPGTFEGNIRIRKLWLQNNPLKTLMKFNFPSIPHLRLLDLSNTQLRRIRNDVKAFKATKVETLGK